MRNSGLFLAAAVFLVTLPLSAKSQDNKSGAQFNAGVDVYSNYIFRGTKFGQGPAVQPSLKFSYGNFATGVWGSFDASGFMETDPYVSFSFPFGLSLGFTDYFYPALGGSFFSDSSNAFEVNAGFARGGLSLSANYIFNEATVPASKGGDKYFQAYYSFEKFFMSAGAGDGWHTTDGSFDICHLGIGTVKIINITESFSVPLTGQVILNPDRNQLFLIAGFGF